MELVIDAEKRSSKVRNIFRKSIREGYIPCVMYNKGLNVPISINRHDFIKKFNHAMPNSIFTIHLDGKSERAIIKDYQEKVKSHEIEHVDFYVVQSDVPVKVRVPINITGMPVGVTQGGVLQTFQKEVKILAKPDDIPEAFDIDISGLDVDDKLAISDIDVGEGVKILDSAEALIVSVISSAKADAKAAKAEAAAEGEGEEAAEGEAAEGEAAAEGAEKKDGAEGAEKTEDKAEEKK